MTQTIEQLTASQLHAEQLLEALESCYEKMKQMCLNGEWYAPDKAIDLAWNALALHRDTSALDAYVSEKMKEAVSTQKEYYESVFQDGAKRIATLTRQRDNLLAQVDLAVAAMDNLVKQKGRHNTEVAYKRLVEALSTIKENEN